MSGSYLYGGDPPGLESAYHYGLGGRGVLGADIPSGGDDGAPPLYNDLETGDETSEFRIVLTDVPAGLDIFMREDSSFDASAPDGTYVFSYDVYVTDEDVGEYSYSGSQPITFGELASNAPGVTLTATGILIAGLASGATHATAAGVMLTANSILLAGSAETIGGANVPGVVLVASSILIAGSAESITYASAPAGTGYSLRRFKKQSRPPNTQR